MGALWTRFSVVTCVVRGVDKRPRRYRDIISLGCLKGRRIKLIPWFKFISENLEGVYTKRRKAYPGADEIPPHVANTVGIVFI